MQIESIVTGKGRDVVTITPERTVAEAVRLLMEHEIGSLVVVDGGGIVGILTERDVLRIADRDPSALKSTRVDAVMTRDLIVIEAADDVHYAMDVMTRNRIRHLPVVRDGALEGIISIGDVVNTLRRDAEAENRYLRDYVQGMVR